MPIVNKRFEIGAALAFIGIYFMFCAIIIPPWEIFEMYLAQILWVNGLRIMLIGACVGISSLIPL